ncbi:phage portal protein [Streptomyces sp. NPDC059578]|uniref:phage portal protein n=1 Tax=Streptomyces sp. NPDC059578 TaxID=3346874 RepID=UPI0036772F18
MRWWRRRSKSPSPVGAEGVLVPVDYPVKGQEFGDLEALGRYVTAHGIRVVDPGVPLANYADTAAAARVWETQPSVRKVVDYIARQLCTIPWHVYDRASDTDRRRVTDHPLAQLLAQPAPQRSASRVWHNILVDWLIYDRWCLRVLPSADTVSGYELRRKPARRFHVLADDDDEPEALYLISSRGPAEVVMLPAPFLFDHGYSTIGANGTSPMVTLQQILAEQREAVEWRRQVWRSGARVPAVIERPADAPAWSSTAKERFIAGFNAFVGRGPSAGGTPLLEDGMTLKTVGAFNPRETQDIEGRQLTDAEVAAAYHIAPELVGAREGTFSNIDAFRQMLFTISLGPYVTQWQDVLNSMLVPLIAPGSRLYVEAHVEAKLKGSFTEQAALLQTAVGAPYMLRSEARAVQNLPHVDGTDELVTPLNVVVGGLASPRDTAPPKGRSGVRPGGPARPGAKAARPEDLGTFDAERDALTGALTEWAQRQADGLLDRASAQKNSDGPPDFYDLWAASSDERRAQLSALLLSYGLRLAQIGAWDVLGLWNPEADGWDVGVMEAWLAAAAASHAEQYEGAAYTAATEAVTAEGDWQVLLQEGLAHWVTDAAVRAATAATEARSFGGADAAGASGLTHKVWRTGGKNPRASHVRMDGDSVELGGTFSNGLRWPGDANGSADETANCNCRVDYSREGG